MISIAKLRDGLAAYLDAELIPQFPVDSWRKVAAGAALSIALKRIDNVTDKLRNSAILQGMGVVDEAGNVDIDAVRDAVKEQMANVGMKIDIPLIGVVTFQRNDVDKAYEYVMRS